MTESWQRPAERPGARPVLSVVVPAYNEQGNLSTLYAELVDVLSAIGLGWEVVLVDDGSDDGTWLEIGDLHDRDSRVAGVRLSRNFGHQQALVAGLHRARGDAVISLDADMQHPPSLIASLVAEWQNGNKIVKAVRRDPGNSPVLKRLTSRVFYRVFSYLSGVDLQSGSADFRLLDRQVLDELLQFREAGLFLRGLVEWVGYRSTSVTFEPRDRLSGVTKYTFRRMLRFAWHGVSSFSLVPLRLAVIMGLGSSFIAFLGVAYAILARWFDDRTVAGWASSVAIISFLFGVLFLFLAVLAEYLGRILEEVRGRPRYIVAECLAATGERGGSESDGGPPGGAGGGI